MTSLLIWTAGERRTQLLCAAVLAVFAWYLAIYLGLTLASPAPRPFGDFIAFWSWGRFLVGHPAADVYDPARLFAALVEAARRRRDGPSALSRSAVGG